MKWVRISTIKWLAGTPEGQVYRKAMRRHAETVAAHHRTLVELRGRDGVVYDAVMFEGVGQPREGRFPAR